MIEICKNSMCVYVWTNLHINVGVNVIYICTNSTHKYYVQLYE